MKGAVLRQTFAADTDASSVHFNEYATAMLRMRCSIVLKLLLSALCVVMPTC